jgi:hypothetical protein
MTTTRERSAGREQLEAGRTLDILIAERVFGWTRWDGKGDWDGPDDVTFFLADEDHLAVYGPREEEPSGYAAFSENIEDAWEVVERLKKAFDLKLLCILDEGWEVSVYTKFWDNSDPVAVECAESAPLAICLAALKAVETAQ